MDAINEGFIMDEVIDISKSQGWIKRMKENLRIVMQNTISEIILPKDDFYEWYIILIQDDIVHFDQLLDAVNDEEKVCLFNGRFEYKYDVDNRDEVKYVSFGGLARPLMISMAFGSTQCCYKMIKGGADLFITDILNSNLVHILVYAVYSNRRRETQCIEIYKTIMKDLMPEVRRKLLMQEDSNGFRPLELAAKLGIFCLLGTILTQDDIYIKKRNILGLITRSTYDFSDYASGYDYRRFLRSPIRFLQFTNESSKDSLIESKLHFRPIVINWIHHQFGSNLPFIIMWLCYRLIFLVCLIIFDPLMFTDQMVEQCNLTYFNFTTSSSTPGCWWWDIDLSLAKFTLQSMALSFFHIGYDIALFVYWRFVNKERRTALSGCFESNETYLGYTYFYRYNQFILCSLCAFIPLFCTFFKFRNPETFMSVMFLFKALYIPFAILSLFHILELLPFIGIFAITLQKMLATIIKFGLILILIQIVFYFFFSEVGSKIMKERDSGVSNMYFLFLLSIGSANFGTNPNYYIMLAHVLFYGFSSLLLINYLIAALSSELISDSDKTLIVQGIRRVMITFQVEDRLIFWVNRLKWKITGRRPSLILTVSECSFFHRLGMQFERDENVCENGIICDKL